jgi:hypothetical protein
METDGVRALLQRFQKGYTERDLSKLDEFMALFACEGQLEVIGTNGVAPGEGEWCLDGAAVRRLVAGDWEHWGDVRLDLEGARISRHGDVAWLATTGTVTDTITAQEVTEEYLELVESKLGETGSSPQEKMLEILREGTDILLSMQEGDRYVWPFRFTAVVVRDDAGWRFRQMQFSFPTTRVPDVRTC